MNLTSELQPRKGVYISTYGCQMNVNDSERMLSLLEMSDYGSVGTPEEADLIIINSCSVREKPVHKVHSEAGWYRKMKEKNPNLRVGVGGCVGQQERDKLLKDIPYLDFVFGPDNIDSLPEIVDRVRRTPGGKGSYARFEHSKPYQIETLVRNPGVATFVNITKGCDNFCTFCVVPFTRGRLRSRPTKDIVEDVHKLVNRGVKEVTLLGQNVNSFGTDSGEDFSDLLRILAEDTNIERIRYTTSHPKDFNLKLAQTMRSHRSKLCDYIHLPVQSGSSKILEQMNRGYSRSEYLEKIQMILEHVPGVALSTDLIVGFPGETEEDFLETLTLLDEVPFESVFAFGYSPRPFTKASRFDAQIDEEVKSQRLTQILETHRNIAFKLAQKYQDQVLPVLVEKEDEERKGIMTGRTTQNKVVHFNGSMDLIGQTVPVRITRGFPQTLLGERV